jgi:hypothetical protein
MRFFGVISLVILVVCAVLLAVQAAGLVRHLRLLRKWNSLSDRDLRREIARSGRK